MKEIEGFEMSKLNLIEEELKFKNWEILDYGHNSSVPKCKESVSEKSLYSEIRAKYPNFPWKRPEVDTEIGLWEFGTRKKGEEVILRQGANYVYGVKRANKTYTLEAHRMKYDVARE